jgi:Transposase, Mutator family
MGGNRGCRGRPWRTARRQIVADRIGASSALKDVFFLVCDGLRGLPGVVAHVWPLTTVQTCIIHLIRNVRREALVYRAGVKGPRRRLVAAGRLKLRAA